MNLKINLIEILCILNLYTARIKLKAVIVYRFIGMYNTGINWYSNTVIDSL
jgi:hypothetical protein